MINNIKISIIAQISNGTTLIPGKHYDPRSENSARAIYMRDIIDENSGVVMGMNFLNHIEDRSEIDERPYPHATNFLLFTAIKDPKLPSNTTATHTVSETLEKAKQRNIDHLYILGGKFQFDKYMEHADEIYFIHDHLSGYKQQSDIDSPDWNRDDWVLQNPTTELPDDTMPIENMEVDYYERITDPNGDPV